MNLQTNYLLHFRTGEENTNRIVQIKKNAELWNIAFREHVGTPQTVMGSFQWICRKKSNGDSDAGNQLNAHNVTTDPSHLLSTKK